MFITVRFQFMWDWFKLCICFSQNEAISLSNKHINDLAAKFGLEIGNKYATDIQKSDTRRPKKTERKELAQQTTWVH